MAQMTIRGATIDYDDQGQGAALVLIHGSPFNRSMWQPQVNILTSSYRVITFDLRGYGRSTASLSDKTFLSDFANDIAGLMDALKVSSAGVMGLSMGGQIALEFYRLYPERVTALILADTFAQLDTPENKQNRYRTADRLMQEGMQGYADDNLSKMICPQTIAEKPDVAKHVMDMMLTTPPVGAAAALRGRAERQDYTDLLGQIAAPTLIVVGDQDVFTPVADAQYMHARTPQSELVVITEAGHMPNLEQPDAFNQALLSFLKDTARIG
jgi:3-oxoadipate enol-lactonase